MDVELEKIKPVFTWSKPDAGFYWEDVEEGEPHPPALPPLHRVRTVLFFDLSENKVTKYRPLEEKPTLFYDFADTEPTKEGILAFANKYGSLKHNAVELADEKSILDHRPPIKSDDPLGKLDAIMRQRFENGVDDEGLTNWQHEINEMSAITTLLEYWQNKDKQGLQEVFNQVLLRHENGKWDFMFFDLQGWPYVHDEQEANRYIRQRIMRKIIFMAQELLMFWVNGKFAEMFSGSFNLQLSLNAKAALELYLEPKSLLDAMWIQLCQAIISASQGERRIKRCEICRDPIILWEYGERKQNSNWRYHPECYSSRKQKEYRDRKRQLKEAEVKKPAGNKSIKKPAKKAKPKAAKKATTKKTTASKGRVKK